MSLHFAHRLMVVQQLYTLLCTEVIAKRWSTYYGYPNCTIASLHTATVGIFAVPLNLLLDKLGLYKVNADPATLRKKLGFMDASPAVFELVGSVHSFQKRLKRTGFAKGTVLYDAHSRGGMI